jgi:eukaryotic-like serine/threonine-protein kinase
MVWLARDEDLDALVAIKLLAENWAANDDVRRRFLEEARALRRLDNDRIVRVYEVGRLDDGRPYMVMEFADLGTLEDRMRLRASVSRPFSVREAVEIAVDIAECLISVHDLRIVHRDLKPSNVLFRSIPPERQEAMRRDGRPVVEERTLLADFGIARRLEGMLGHTMVLGSPHYMAPEQADPARAGLVDYRGDIYSAAAILYEMLAGRLPFGFDSITQLQRMRRDDVPAQPIATLRPDVPRALGNAIQVGLSADPADRFGSAWEWRDVLSRSIAGEVSEDATDPFVRRLFAPKTRGGSTAGAGTRPTERPSGTAPAPTRRKTAILDGAGSHSTRGSEPGARVGDGGWPRAEPVDGLQPAAGRQAKERTAAPRPAPTVSLRMPAAGAVGSGLLLFAGVLMPWSSEVHGVSESTESVALSAFALILVLAGVRMWRTARRWVAKTASLVAMTAGLAAMAVVALAVIRIEGTVSFGPFVVFTGGALGMVGGQRALLRLRWALRPWDRGPSRLPGPAGSRRS